MNEYEFRLVVQHHEPFALHHFCDRGTIHTHTVLYATPHVRYRRRRLEVKTILDTRMVYYKSFWFKWVHSLETPYTQWSPVQHDKFLEGLQTKTNYFEKQTRQQIDLDRHARLYTFKHVDGFYRLIFEWEYGSWPTPLPHHHIPLNDLLVHHVSRYWNIFKKFKPFPVPPYTLKECVIRKSVTYRRASDHCLVAHKWDGIFGIVYSYADYIKAKWEDGMQERRHGLTLGDGLVFAAEKTDHGIVLLDVYQVYGFPTASECRQSILMECLTQLELPPDGDIHVQQYRATQDALPVTRFQRDGIIRHDLCNDTISKVKTKHSLDVVYMDGFFWLPAHPKGGKRRFACLENSSSPPSGVLPPPPLVNGHVYEVCIESGRVVRERSDRLTGNTCQQIDAILTEGRTWKGPNPMEDVVAVAAVERSKKKRKMFTKR